MKALPKIITSGVGIALCCALNVLTAQAAPNMIYDPSFENLLMAPNPNPNGVPGWATFGGATFSSTYAHTGSLGMDTPGGAGGYSVPGAYEVFAANPGQTFTLSGWVYTPNALVPNSNDFAILQLSFFAGSPPNNFGGAPGVGPAVGVNVGTPSGGGGVPLPQGVWTFASISATAPAGANSLGVYLLNINADSNAHFAFDDISLTVPEPTTLSLCALGLLGLPLLRLRKRS
jgi:hypothetical protein